MGTLSELIVKLGIDPTKFESGLKKASASIESVGKKMTSIGKKLSLAVTAPLTGIGIAAVKMAGNLEQSRIAFTTMLGDAKKAYRFLGNLRDFAARTPFEFTGLQQSSRQLLAFGFQAQEIIPMMTAIGDAVSGLGGGAFEISRVVRALGQVKAKGKVAAQEMMQLAELGIPAWQILAETLGTDIPTAMKMGEQGVIDATTAINGLIAGMNRRFSGMMEQQSQTLLGLWSTFRDNIGMVLADVGENIIKAFDLKNVLKDTIEYLQDFVKWFKELDNSSKKLIIGIGTISALAGPLLVTLGQLALAINQIAIAMKAVNLAMLGRGAFIVAITIGAYQLGKFFNEMVRGTSIMKAFEARLTILWLKYDKLVEKVEEAYDLLHVPTPEDFTKRMFGSVFKDLVSDINAAVEKAKESYWTAKAAGGEEGKGAESTRQTNDALFEQNILLDDQAFKIQQNIEYWQLFNQQIGGTQPLLEKVTLGLADMTNTFAQGVGRAVAAVIVYGESTSKVFKNLMKQIAAQVIATLVEIGIQEIISAVIGTSSAEAQGSAKIASNLAQIGTLVYLKAIEEQGLSGIGTGAALAAAAVATAAGIAGAAIGTGHGVGSAIGQVKMPKVGGAKGGIFETPSLISVAEIEPEIVLNKRNIREFGLDSGGRDLHAIFEMDGDALMEWWVKNAPDYLRTRAGVEL